MSEQRPRPMSQQDYARAIAACGDDAACRAIVQGDYVASLVAYTQVAVLETQFAVVELTHRFDAYEQRGTELARVLADAVIERIRQSGSQDAVLAETVRAEAAQLASVLAQAAIDDRALLQAHLDRIDVRLAGLVPPSELRERLDQLEDKASVEDGQAGTS